MKEDIDGLLHLHPFVCAHNFVLNGYRHILDIGSITGNFGIALDRNMTGQFRDITIYAPNITGQILSSGNSSYLELLTNVKLIGGVRDKTKYGINIYNGSTLHVSENSFVEGLRRE